MRAAALFALLASGCAGGAPLLHPAHTLPQGDVTAGAGVSARVAEGGIASAIQGARETTVHGLAIFPADAGTYRKGALALAGISPGVSPWVGARVGLGSENEAGLTYTGKDFRVDLRHAFETPHYSFSIGAAASALLIRRDGTGQDDLVGLNTQSVTGYGFDVPVLVGYRSDAGLIQIIAGARAGFDHVGGRIGLGDPASTAANDDGLASLSARHVWGGGLVGFILGFRHLYAAVELDAYVHDLRGTIGDASVQLSGFSLAPAGALVGKF